MAARTYYKLPRISRTPSPPREYLRRRQEMGGASLPPMPEDERYLTEMHSTAGTPDPEILRPKKKRKSVGSLRVKQKAKNGPVSWDRILSDVEEDGEILDSITVKGAVLSSSLNAARDSATKNKIVSQKIRSRRQSITAAPTATIGGVLPGDRVVEAQDSTTVAPVPMENSGTTPYVPPTPHASSSTSPNTPVNTLSKKKSVKYIRPYQAAVVATPPLVFWSTSTPTTEGEENQAALVTPPRPILVQSAATPDDQLQQEQQNAMVIDESTHPQQSPFPEAAPPPVNGSLTITVAQPTEPTLTEAAAEGSTSPVPADFVFHISRTGADITPPLSVRPFKVYGRDFIKSGRWMWQQLISTIKDRTHFDTTQDEILLNWVLPLPNIEMLRDQGKEMKRALENEIIVVRTTREGYWPDWIYERVKERRRQWKRDRERERAERERREAEERERREAEERAARANSQDTIDAPLEEEDGMLDVVAVGGQLATPAAEATAQEDQEMLDTVAVRPAGSEVVASAPVPSGNGEGSSKRELPKEVEREEIVVSKVRGTPSRRKVANTPPPLEDEAIAPEIPESQEIVYGTEAPVENVLGALKKAVIPATFTPVNRPQEGSPHIVQQQAALSATSSVLAGPARAVLAGTSAVTPTAAPDSAQFKSVPTPATPASVATVPAIASGLTTISASKQTPVAKGTLATTLTPPPPRPLPQFRGRPIPMPPAYNRPANMPSRPTFSAASLVPGAPVRNTSLATIHTLIAPPQTAIVAGQKHSTGSVSQQVVNNSASNPSPPKAVQTSTGTTTTTTAAAAAAAAAAASISKARSGSAELPPAVAAAAQTPLAKWLAKQGGPTALPKAVAKAVKVTNSGTLSSRGKKLGRPVRKSMPAAVGGQTTPSEQEATIRLRQDQAAEAQQTDVLSPQQQLQPANIADISSAAASGTSSAISSYAASIASTTSSTTSSHSARSISEIRANAYNTSVTNNVLLNPLANVHPPLSSTATSTAVSPALSFASEGPAHTPAATKVAPITSAITSSTQTPHRTPKPQTYANDYDSDLDLNLDLHLAPRTKKETRVPSWVKSKTPVAKGRLSMAGKLGDFPSPTTPIPTTPAAARALRTFGGTGRATWGGEMPRSDTLEKQEVTENGNDPMDEDDDDDMDIGLDLQRGTKRPRDSLTASNISPGTSGKSKSNSFDLMGFTSQRRTTGYDLSPVNTSRMKSKSKSKRVRREVGSDDDGDDEEGFLTWEGEGKAVTGEMRNQGDEDEEDLDLGF